MRRYNSPLIAAEKRYISNVTHALTGPLKRGSASRWHLSGGSMKLFARFFQKAPPSSPTMEERIAILNAGSVDAILGAALGTDEEGLRVAAIHRLPDGDALRRFAGLLDLPHDASVAVPAVLERAAQARVAQLIDAGSIDFTVICDQARRRPALLSVAVLCKDTGRLAQALASIDDPGQIARLVMEGATSRLRQSAAELVEDPAQLQQLLATTPPPWVVSIKRGDKLLTTPPLRG